jgi:hypothetical protein
MYEAWSAHYERELVAGISNNVVDEAGANNNTKNDTPVIP